MLPIWRLKFSRCFLDFWASCALSHKPFFRFVNHDDDDYDYDNNNVQYFLFNFTFNSIACSSVFTFFCHRFAVVLVCWCFVPVVKLSLSVATRVATARRYIMTNSLSSSSSVSDENELLTWKILPFCSTRYSSELVQSQLSSPNCTIIVYLHVFKVTDAVVPRM